MHVTAHIALCQLELFRSPSSRNRYNHGPHLVSRYDERNETLACRFHRADGVFRNELDNSRLSRDRDFDDDDARAVGRRAPSVEDKPVLSRLHIWEYDTPAPLVCALEMTTSPGW
jgi:hypothetical protein